jgi:hypothetical protein
MFKAKMVQRMTGPNAVSANRLAKEMGINQQTLSRWLMDARTLPLVARSKSGSQRRSVEEKARIVSEAGKLSDDELTQFLQREGVQLAELEQWRLALDEEARVPNATARHIRELERELARKEKALAEAAALLVLKKKAQALLGDEDDDTDEENES